MKQTINRTKTEAARFGTRAFSTRAVAVLLCCVMLLTAIGAGSVFSAFAVTRTQSAVTADAAVGEQQGEADAVDAAAVADADVSPDNADSSIAAPAAVGAISKKGSDLASTGAKVDVAGTGRYGFTGDVYLIFTKDTAHTSGQVNGENVTDSERGYLLGSYGNEGSTEVYLKTNTSGTIQHTYNVKFKNSNNDMVSFGNWTYYADSTSIKDYNSEMKTNQDVDKISVAVQSNGYAKVYVKLWNEYGGNNRVEVKYTAVSTLTYNSLTPGSSSLDSGGTTTLTPSVSGGSGDYNHSYVVRQGSSSGTVVSGCMSGNTFTAPSVSSSTTYYITDTVTDKKCPGLASKTKTTTITVGPKSNYYLWGGEKKELDKTVYLTTLALNTSTGRYEGTYTLNSTNWHSFLMSGGPNTSTFNPRVWTAYSQVAWSLNTYNNGKVYSGYTSNHREPSTGSMSDGLISFVEITNYGDSWGLKLAAKNAGTTVNLSYDATAKVLYITAGEVTGVDIYAKDGAAPINWNSKEDGGASATTGTAYNYAAIATTTLSGTGQTVNTGNCGVSSSGYKYSLGVEPGKTITVTTTITNSNSWPSKYYVKGWCINGVTYNTGGVAGVNANPGKSQTDYTMNYEIPTDVTGLPKDAAGKPCLEITPIYYLQSATTVTFYLEGYNTIQSKWGNTPYVYPFYGNLENVKNSFGVYPGQPMVYANGQYSIEIPLYDTPIISYTGSGSTPVKGITINNGYADHVHRNLIYDWSDADHDAAHKQTYDYDDFYKIYNERLDSSGNKPNSIIFRIQDEDTVFNRSSYGGGKSGQFADGTSKINIDTINSFGNGWELLTDRYERPVNIFGDYTKVSAPGSGVTATSDTSNAIYVVSTGYNANIAGDYGTMWKIYNGSGTLISTDATNARYGIPPSALLLRGSTSGYDAKAKAVGYPDASHSVDGVGSYTDSLSKYESIYKTLQGSSYVNKRVYITYEKNTQDTRDDSTGTGAYRLDGRWYYTHASDRVQSTIGIEYWDNATGKWVADTVTASTGKGSKGNTAVFDSGSYTSTSNKITSTNPLISDNKTWSFTATAASGYLFDSWQIKYSDTSYDEIIGTGTTRTLPATANYTLVARFVPVVTGALTITHALNSASTGEGSADLSVVIKNGTSTMKSYTGTVTDGVARVFVDSYISNSYPNYTVNVTLTSSPLYDAKVTAFSYDSLLSVDATETNLNKEGTNATSTFSFKVSDLFSGTTQIITGLGYTSTIAETLHYYDFTYNFTDRSGAAKSYTSHGTLSLSDFKNYVTGEHVLDASYVSAKAPFESNFLKSTTLSVTSPTYTSSTHTFSKTYSFSETSSVPLHHVVVKLPYNYYTGSSGTSYKKYNANGTAYVSDQATFDLAANYNEFLTIGATSAKAGSQTKVSKVTDTSDANHTGNDFITAPDELKNGSTTMYFNYWRIIKLEQYEEGMTDNQKNASTIARVYFPDFHYRIYSDYYVEAVYTAQASDSWRMKYSDDVNNVGASIIYLGDSRNQWNTSAAAGSSSDSETVAADMIYSDFIFNYADKGRELKGAKNVEIGMVIERATYMDNGTQKWLTGSTSVTDMNEYRTTYGGTADTSTESARGTAILNWLKGGAQPSGTIKQVWNTSDLNNKNFMENSYSVYSAYGQTVAEDGSITFKNDNTIDDYVYRAYAYIKASDGAYYLSEPAYFCMRYTANRKFS